MICKKVAVTDYPIADFRLAVWVMLHDRSMTKSSILIIRLERFLEWCSLVRYFNESEAEPKKSFWKTYLNHVEISIFEHDYIWL